MRRIRQKYQQSKSLVTLSHVILCCIVIYVSIVIFKLYYDLHCDFFMSYLYFLLSHHPSSLFLKSQQNRGNNRLLQGIFRVRYIISFYHSIILCVTLYTCYSVQLFLYIFILFLWYYAILFYSIPLLFDAVLCNVFCYYLLLSHKSDDNNINLIVALSNLMPSKIYLRVRITLIK